MDRRLEKRLQQFAVNDLKCEVRFIKQENNNESSLRLFNWKVEEIEESLRKLERLDFNQRS